MVKARLHISFVRILLSIGIAAGALMLLSAVKTKDAKPCSKVVIQYHNDQASGFIHETEVLQIISKQTNSRPVGTPLQRFNLKAIEVALENHAWVRDAQLYFDNNQALHVLLEAPVPIARAFDAGGNSFYLDVSGNALPLQENYRMDLPVFTGLPVQRDSGQGKSILARVCRIAAIMAADSFWQVQAAQIDVLPNGKMELVPVIGNHMVELGYATAPEAMLARLKIFYKATAAAGVLHTYERLNASYSGQIVAKRSKTNITEADKAAAMMTYQHIVKHNRDSVNARSITSAHGVGRLLAEPAPAIPKKQKDPLPTTKSTVPIGIADKQDEGKAKRNEPAAETEKKEERKPKAIMPKIEDN